MSSPIAFRPALIIVIVSFASSLPYGAKIIPSPGPKTRGPDMYGLYGYIQTVDCMDGYVRNCHAYTAPRMRQHCLYLLHMVVLTSIQGGGMGGK